jgi:hypothetical protein
VPLKKRNKLGFGVRFLAPFHCAHPFRLGSFGGLRRLGLRGSVWAGETTGFRPLPFVQLDFRRASGLEPPGPGGVGVASGPRMFELVGSAWH